MGVDGRGGDESDVISRGEGHQGGISSRLLMGLKAGEEACR